MSNQTDHTPAAEPGKPVTELKEFTLKKQLTYKGEPKEPGAKVKLNARQAEWLKESGHI